MSRVYIGRLMPQLPGLTPEERVADELRLLATSHAHEGAWVDGYVLDPVTVGERRSSGRYPSGPARRMLALRDRYAAHVRMARPGEPSGLAMLPHPVEGGRRWAAAREHYSAFEHRCAQILALLQMVRPVPRLYVRDAGVWRAVTARRVVDSDLGGVRASRARPDAALGWGGQAGTGEAALSVVHDLFVDPRRAEAYGSALASTLAHIPPWREWALPWAAVERVAGRDGDPARFADLLGRLVTHTGEPRPILADNAAIGTVRLVRAADAALSGPPLRPDRSRDCRARRRSRRCYE